MENTLYVGKYKVREEGIIKLPKSKLIVLSKFLSDKKIGQMKYTGKTDTKGKKLFEDDRITIVIEDTDFWPCISKMDLKEAEKFRNALTEVIEYKKKGRRPQLIKTV
ncbi:MAG: hypothetical protein WC614_05470 [bacterium]